MRRGRGGGEGVRIRDHLANVRTFLAWMRAGLVLLAIGYAVTTAQIIESLPNRFLGVVAALAGWLLMVSAGVGFFRQRRAIEALEFVPSVSWNLGLSVLAAIASAAVFLFLLKS